MTHLLAADFLAGLRRTLPADGFSQDPAVLEKYGKDWTKVYSPAPGAVVFPRTTDEVVEIVRLCSAAGVPIVPSGGRTGYAGGAVASAGEVVLSLERMRRMDPVEPNGDTVRVQAGAITEAVHQHCAPHGLTWPVDFASKGSSQVGGNIATNAGGVKVIRYGLTRQWVLGLQVVLASGDVLEMNGALEKNNTGVDLRQLFIGSEGILGIVTEATLKLTRLPRDVSVVLFTLPTLADVLALFRAARRAAFGIMAYEFFTDRCLDRLQRHRKLRSPFAAPAPYYVLIEIENTTPEALESWITAVFEAETVTDGVVAHTASQAAELWALREGISESLAATGMPHKNDVALPIANLQAFCGELDTVFAARYPDWEICLFGHIGDGNLHINIMKPESLSKQAFLLQTHAADHELFALVQKHHGSISAEHGIGLLKKDYLTYSRTPAELALLKTVKRALDPQNILNRGKVIDP